MGSKVMTPNANEAKKSRSFAEQSVFAFSIPYPMHFSVEKTDRWKFTYIGFSMFPILGANL